MSSATSTKAEPDDSFRPWHIFALLSMAAAAAIVWAARDTHPLSLMLLSAGVLASGFVGYTFFRALSSLLGASVDVAPMTERTRDALIREKALLLRSIKELEFDRSMGKIGEADYADISGRLRARALVLMQDIERASEKASEKPSEKASGRASGKTSERASEKICQGCRTPNPGDARFCKNCGARLEMETV